MQAQGMQGWRRFTFFDRDDAAAAAQPDTLAACGLETASCAAAAGSWLAFGRTDGSVALLDTTSQAVTAFRAYPTAVQHMVVLPGRKLMATIGGDAAAPEGITLRVWDPAAVLAASSGVGPAAAAAPGAAAAAGSASAPSAAAAPQPLAAATPLASVRLFPAKQPPAGTVTAVAVSDAAWPQLQIAVGLSSGGVQLMRGDADKGRDKFTRTMVGGAAASGGAAGGAAAAGASAPVTGLHFGRPSRGGGQHLFVVTAAAVSVVDTDTAAQTPLEGGGAAAGCTALDARHCLVAARHDAISVYTRDARGPVFVFPGEKHMVACVRHYVVVVTDLPSSRAAALAAAAAAGQGPEQQQQQQDAAPAAGGSSPALVQVYDLRNKLLAGSLEVETGVRAVLGFGGGVAVLAGGGRLAGLRERDLATRLDLLFAKGLHGVALNVAEAAQAEPGVVAEVHRRAGDALYARRDYGAAVAEYCETVGQLEPSYVIRRFLDAQRIHNLAAYLAHLHAKGLASSDHTTLLLNCYAKLRDTAKLDRFLRAEGPDGKPALSFDVDTAIKVCRAAGYHEHALFVAQAAGESAVYLDVLLADCGAFDEALTYLEGLPRRAAADALKKYGKALVAARPEAATALAMQLCSPGAGSGADAGYVAAASDFAHIYADRPLALMLLTEYILNSQPEPPGQAWLYRTLLELYLSPNLTDEPASGSSEAAGAGGSSAGAPQTDSSAPSSRQDQEAGSGSGAAAGGPGGGGKQQSMRREQALELLRRGWPGGGTPRFDADAALVLCRMRGFTAGLLFLYERMRLPREVLQLHMAGGDRAGVIAACLQLGDAGQGGDGRLWDEALQWFGQLDADCSAEVKVLIQHIEARQLLPPAVVLQALAPNAHLQLGVVKDYVSRQLGALSARIAEDRAAAEKLAAESAAMRAETAELQTKARVFQASRCALSGAPLELPAVHFFCGHSFNGRALGEADSECPLCGPGFRGTLDIRAALEAGASEQDKFFTQLRNSADGFGVVADFFGRGLLNHTSVTAPAAALPSPAS